MEGAGKRSRDQDAKRLSHSQALKKHKAAVEEKKERKSKKKSRKERKDKKDKVNLEADAEVGGIKSHFAASSKAAKEDSDSSSGSEEETQRCSPKGRKATGNRGVLDSAGKATKATGRMVSKTRINWADTVQSLGSEERAQLLVMLGKDENFEEIVAPFQSGAQSYDSILKPIPTGLKEVPKDAHVLLREQALADPMLLNVPENHDSNYSFSNTSKKWPAVLDHLASWTKPIKAVTKVHKATIKLESTNYDLQKKIYFYLPAELYPRTTNAFCMFVKWSAAGVVNALSISHLKLVVVGEGLHEDLQG